MFKTGENVLKISKPKNIIFSLIKTKIINEMLKTTTLRCNKSTQRCIKVKTWMFKFNVI
jgi:hypothetical protein